MRQKALVITTYESYAVVEVSRVSMCDGCSQQTCNKHTCSAGKLFGTNKKITAIASNPIGAVAGESVWVETRESTLLITAALVFIMPILLSGLFYWIGERIVHTQIAGYCSAFIGFILAFVILSGIERYRKEKVPDIVITDILQNSLSNGVA